MIRATVIIQENNTSFGGDVTLRATRHQFDVQYNRRGDITAELADLIAFLDKLRVGNGGEAETSATKLPSVLGNAILAAARAVKESHRDIWNHGGCFGLNDASNARAKLETALSQFFPELFEIYRKDA